MVFFANLYHKESENFHVEKEGKDLLTDALYYIFSWDASYILSI
jgi:hypothetical protein